MLLRGLILSLFCSLTFLGLSQEGVIKISNPSFEDLPGAGNTPRNWYDCGQIGQTAPDTQPGFFEVQKKPSEGSTYLGLVVRDNETNEGVAQRLKTPLKAGTCYELTIDLARSAYYVSPSQLTKETVNYTTGSKLRIWAGNSAYCDKKDMLAETGRINNSKWMTNTFKLEPTVDYNYIFLEAYYVTPTLFAYNGNILLDNMSDIVPIPCNEEEALAMAKKEEPKVNVKPKPKPKKEEPKVEPAPKPEPKKEEPVVAVAPPKKKVLKALDSKTIREGQTIRIDQLYFEVDSYDLAESSIPVLDELYDFMIENNALVLEIGGHTNGIPQHDFCDRLSKQRAKSVVDFLIEKGVDKNRLVYKGYGKRKPISSNKTKDGRKRNQRVEIKILSI